MSSSHYGGSQHAGHHGHGSAGASPAYPVLPGPVPGNRWEPASYAGVPYYPDLPYAGWGLRVGGYLLDMITGIGLLVLALIIGGLFGSLTKNTAVGGAISVVLALAAVAWYVHNRYVRAGRTGQSLGKRAAGIWLVDERTGQPIGGLMAFARDLAHVVDGITFYIGYLMPLWDARRQTFADKIAHTIVLRTAVTGGPRPAGPQPDWYQTGWSQPGRSQPGWSQPGWDR
jgi:uncharacterized RDD family membrane protein YckC